MLASPVSREMTLQTLHGAAILRSRRIHVNHREVRQRRRSFLAWERDDLPEIGGRRRRRESCRSVRVDAQSGDGVFLQRYVSLPPAPSGLAATISKDGKQVQISWKAARGATSYIVERSLGKGGAWSQVYAGSDRQYADGAITSGNTYTYRVRAKNLFGQSAWSVLNVAVPKPMPPWA